MTLSVYEFKPRCVAAPRLQRTYMERLLAPLVRREPMRAVESRTAMSGFEPWRGQHRDSGLDSIFE
jgi:hypothetical protein